MPSHPCQVTPEVKIHHYGMPPGGRCWDYYPGDLSFLLRERRTEMTTIGNAIWCPLLSLLPWCPLILVNWLPLVLRSCPGSLSHLSLVPQRRRTPVFNISLGNSLSPVRNQAITWASTDLLSIGHLAKKLQWNLNRNTKLFIHEKAFVNVGCQMAARGPSQ